jgi:hypothetical protein
MPFTVTRDQRYRHPHRCSVDTGASCGVGHKWCARSSRWPAKGFDKKGDATKQCAEWNKREAAHDKQYGLKGDDE